LLCITNCKLSYSSSTRSSNIVALTDFQISMRLRQPGGPWKIEKQCILAQRRPEGAPIKAQCPDYSRDLRRCATWYMMLHMLVSHLIFYLAPIRLGFSINTSARRVHVRIQQFRERMRHPLRCKSLPLWVWLEADSVEVELLSCSRKATHLRRRSPSSPAPD
jgi:hypothetical protein